MPTDIMSPNLYYSYDARSEYPYIMVCKKMPMDKIVKYTDSVSKMSIIDNLRADGYALLFDLHLSSVEVYDHVTVPYIPYSKCIQVAGKPVLDNGRILKADYIHITVTDIDLDIIMAQYHIEHKAIKNLYISAYDYLPDPIVNHVRDGFYEKCGYEERGEKKTYYYDRCKNRLNGNFGMMYTDPVRESVIVNDFVSEEKHRFEVQENDDIQGALNKFYKSRNSFLCYEWGVWITAHARAHHQKLIDCFGMEFIYGDTDSGKGTDVTGEVAKKVESLNRSIEKECLPRKAYYDMANGTRLYMGVFVNEGTMTDFRTLGAKKYAYTDDEGLHVTISGVPKKNSKGVTSADELCCIDNFKVGTVFKECGGIEARYHDLNSPETKIFYDENGKPHEVTYGSNISMIDSEYTLGVGNDYGKLMELLKNI